MQKSPALPPVQVRLLYTEGCPHAPGTAELVRSVAADMGIPIQLHTILVESEDQADQLRCVRSPTVLVNGLDIVPAARQLVSYGLG